MNFIPIIKIATLTSYLHYTIFTTKLDIVTFLEKLYTAKLTLKPLYMFTHSGTYQECSLVILLNQILKENLIREQIPKLIVIVLS